jgi:hypothetical protein
MLAKDSNQCSKPDYEKCFPDTTEVLYHLARIKKNGENFLLAAAISPAGTYIAYSDVNHLRLFSVTLNRTSSSSKTSLQHGLSVSTIAKPCYFNKLHPASQLVFSPDSSKLISISICGLISIVETFSGKTIWKSDYTTLNSQNKNKKLCDQLASVSSLDVSYDGQWFAFCDFHALYLFNMKTYQCYKQLAKIPLTTIAFSPFGAKLAVINAVNHLVLFNSISLRAEKETFGIKDIYETFVNLFLGIVGIFFISSSLTEKLIIYSRNTFYCIDLTENIAEAKIFLTSKKISAISLRDNICLFAGFLLESVITIEIAGDALNCPELP